MNCCKNPRDLEVRREDIELDSKESDTTVAHVWPGNGPTIVKGLATGAWIRCSIHLLYDSIEPSPARTLGPSF